MARQVRMRDSRASECLVLPGTPRPSSCRCCTWFCPGVFEPVNGPLVTCGIIGRMWIIEHVWIMHIYGPLEMYVRIVGHACTMSMRGDACSVRCEVEHRESNEHDNNVGGWHVWSG